MFANLLSFLGIEEAALVEVEIRPFVNLYIHFERLHPCIFNRLPVLQQSSSSTANHAFGLKLECELALW